MQGFVSPIQVFRNFMISNPFKWWIILASLLISSIIIPVVICICRKKHWYDTVDSRKAHTGNIPRLGSMGFVPAFILTGIFYTLHDRAISTSFIPIAVGGAIIFAFGIIDDFLNLRARNKLFVQIVATVIVIASGFRFKLIFEWEMPVFLSITLTFLWIIGIINAYNLIDGLDALCASLSFLALFTYSFIFLFSSEGLSVICLLLCAAILGFLIYNKPKAKIFMGDGGSQFLGFMIATLPLFETTRNYEQNKFFIILNLVSIPMIDCFAAIWRRLRDHKGIMSPDKKHLHHKLLNIGFTKTSAVVFLDIIQILICISVILSMALKGTRAKLLLSVTFIMMLVFFTVIHYNNRRKMQQAS